MANLTKRRLDAVIEALIFRAAGELGDEACPIDDYEGALQWALNLEAQRYPLRLSSSNSGDQP